MARSIYYAYADESGVRKHGPKTSRHFVMSAAVVPGARKATLLDALAGLRTDLRMPVDKTLSFKDMPHQSRLRVCQTLGRLPYLTVTSVIVCKRNLPMQMADIDGAYLLTLRYLLERISWFVDDQNGQAYVTFAHIDRFKIDKLHAYIEVLRATNTQIRWQALFLPLRMETMQGNGFLQVADSVASATAQAVEPDRFGNNEQRYLRELSPRLYRRFPGKNSSYGLKLHPTNVVAMPEYSWLNDL